jgi:hypothetical protein
MIDFKNYKVAIVEAGEILAQASEPASHPSARLALLNRFEVLTNISESILRRVFASLGGPEHNTFLSIRELLRQASDEGLHLATPDQWIAYLAALETMNAEWIGAADVVIEPNTLLLLQGFVRDIQAFANRAERMATVVSE